MVNYENGKIYKLVCLTTGNIYYGSTCQTLSKRLYQHEYKYLDYVNNIYHYCASFEIIKNNNYEIYLVEYYPCNHKDELHKREGEFIINNKCVNKTIAGRTKKQYKIDNYEKCKQMQKKCYENNREYYIEKQKKYLEKNKEELYKKASVKVKCECGCEIRKSDIAPHRKTKKHLNLMNLK